MTRVAQTRTSTRLRSRVSSRLRPGATRYDLLSVGTPLAAGVLPNGGQYTQAAGSNQVSEAVQTSASALLLWAFVANLPRIGLLPDGSTGLVLEPPRTNELLQSRSPNTWNAGTATVTVDAAAGPDGTVAADRIAATSGQYGPFQSPTGLTSSQPYVFSQWVRRGVVGAGSTHGFWEQDATTSAIVSTEVGALTALWQLVANAAQTLGASTTSVTAISCEGRAVGGLTAQARDVMIDFCQVEKGTFPTTALVSVASKVGRGGFGVVFPLSRFVRAGTFRVLMTCVPLGAATGYAADGAALRLWTIDARNYAELNTGTRILTVVVNGTTRTASVALSWTRGQRVQFLFEVGGGKLRVRYRVSSDAGATYGAATDPFGGTVYVDAAISATESTINFYSDTGSKWFGTGAISEDPVTAAPAWAA